MEMVHTVLIFLRIVSRYIMHLGPGGWLVAMLLATTIGLLSLQGYGSRSNY
jgi:hypothetical protein